MAERPSGNRRPRPGPYNTPRGSAGSGPSSGSSGRTSTPARQSTRSGALGAALSGSPMIRSSSFPERAAASQPSLLGPQAASAHSGPIPSLGSARLPSGTVLQPWYYVPRNQADAQAFVRQRSAHTSFPPSPQGGASSQHTTGQHTVTNLASMKLKRQRVLDSNGHETGQVVMMETDLQRAMGSMYVNTSLGAPPVPAGIPWGGPIEGVWQSPNTIATASYPAGGYTTSTQQGNRPSNVGSRIPARRSRAPAQPTRSIHSHPSAQDASVSTTAIPTSSSHDIPRRPRSVVSNAPSTPNSVQTPGTQYWGGNYMGSPSTFQSPVQGRTPPMQLFNRGLGSGASAISPSNPTAKSPPAQRVRAPTANKVEGEENTISKPYPTKPRSLSMDSVVSNPSRLLEDATGGRGGPSTGVHLAYDPSTGHIRVVSDGEVFFMPPMTEEEERSIFRLKPREERRD